MINLYPKKCNICGGEHVVYTSNSRVYGQSFQGRYIYFCEDCGAYVGTQRNSKKALGILADAQMRKGKMICHDLFDQLWKGKRKAQHKRSAAYRELAERMGILVCDCHFGYFDLQELRRAYPIIIEMLKERGYCNFYTDH